MACQNFDRPDYIFAKFNLQGSLASRRDDRLRNVSF